MRSVLKRTKSTQGTTRPCSQHKGHFFFLSQRDKKQGIRDKDRTHRRKKKGEGTRESVKVHFLSAEEHRLASC